MIIGTNVKLSYLGKTGLCSQKYPLKKEVASLLLHHNYYHNKDNFKVLQLFACTTLY